MPPVAGEQPSHRNGVAAGPDCNAGGGLVRRSSTSWRDGRTAAQRHALRGSARSGDPGRPRVLMHGIVHRTLAARSSRAFIDHPSLRKCASSSHASLHRVRNRTSRFPSTREAGAATRLAGSFVVEEARSTRSVVGVVPTGPNVVMGTALPAEPGSYPCTPRDASADRMSSYNTESVVGRQRHSGPRHQAHVSHHDSWNNP